MAERSVIKNQFFFYSIGFVNKVALLSLLFSLFFLTEAQWYWQNPTPNYYTDLEAIKILDSNKILAAGEYGTIYLSTNRGYSWGTSPSGTTETILGFTFINNSYGVAYSLKSLRVTTNGGWSWTAYPEPIVWPKYYNQCFLADSLTLYIASEKTSISVPSGMLLMTHDGGLTWTQILQFGAGNGLRNVHFINDQTGLVTTSDGKVWRTTNGGYNWSLVFTAGVGLRHLEFCDSVHGIITGGGIEGQKTFRTDDGGITWTLVSCPPEYLDEVSYYNLDCIIGVGSNYSVYKSSDGGVTWLQLLRIGGGTSRAFFGVTMDSADIFISGEYGKIYHSPDGGLNWYPSRYGTLNDLTSVCMSDRNNGIISGMAGTILKTTNGGAEWTNITPTSQPLYAVSGTDSLHYIAVGWSGLILKTNDGGNTWTQKNSGTMSYLTDVQMYSNDLGFAIGNGIILKTVNGGDDWTSVSFPGSSGGTFRICIMDSLNILISANTKIYRSTNGGLVWNMVYEYLPIINTLSKMNATSVFAAGSAINYHTLLLKSNDLGATWSPIPSNFSTTCYASSFIDSLNGLVLVDNYEGADVYRTSNGGTSWTFQPFTGVGSGDVQMLNLNDAIAVGKSGSIASTITYHPVPVELSSFEIYSKNNSIYLYWSTSTETNNRGFEIERKNNNSWRTLAFISGHGTTSEIQNYSYTDNLSDLDGVSTVWYRLKQVDYDGSFEYSKEIEIAFAADYILSQNYPNPFNPSTTISYSLPERGKVRLIVYDALGREVRKLVDEEKNAGNYEIKFNGDGLASGMYFYRLSAGEKVISKKMILLK